VGSNPTPGTYSKNEECAVRDIAINELIRRGFLFRNKLKFLTSLSEHLNVVHYEVVESSFG